MVFFSLQYNRQQKRFSGENVVSKQPEKFTSWKKIDRKLSDKTAFFDSDKIVCCSIFFSWKSKLPHDLTQNDTSYNSNAFYKSLILNLLPSASAALKKVKEALGTRLFGAFYLHVHTYLARKRSKWMNFSSICHLFQHFCDFILCAQNNHVTRTIFSKY